MSKVQKELDKIRQQRVENLYHYNPPYFFASPEMKLIFKLVYGAKLTREEKKMYEKMLDRWKAEEAEYLVWHQEP